MEHVDAAIIGYGSAARALAANLTAHGRTVAVVERDERHLGGACNTAACIPTKALVHAARLSAAAGHSLVNKEERYTAAVDDMDRMRNDVRKRSRKAIEDNPLAQLVIGQASFLDATHLAIDTPSGTVQLQADQTFIETGSAPVLPNVPGMDSGIVRTSEQMLDVRVLPQQLVIIGAGYVGLEFASMYADFGSQVTVLQRSGDFLPHEDPDLAEAVLKSLVDRSIAIHLGADVQRIIDDFDRAFVVIGGSQDKRIPADVVLAATGRKPCTDVLNLAAAGVEVDERGGIESDEHRRTTAPNIWVLGDAAGGPQFTYLAYDDYRIISSALFGDGSRTTHNRGAVPCCTFVHPPFARVGMSRLDAERTGRIVKTFKLPAHDISQAHILQDTVGLMAALVDADTDRILGAELFCEDAHELINLFKVAIDEGITAATLHDAVFTHPSMTEAVNNLFA